MSSIDERIVQLTFDNDMFNKGVESSITSIDKLNKALEFNGVDKNFDNIQKSMSDIDFDKFKSNAQSLNDVDFNKLSANVESLAERFSAKGIIIKTVIEDLVHTAESLVARFNRPISMMFNQIKTGGMGRATAIDQAKFKLEGLDVVWKDIEADINYGVHETAYGMDAAASAAAQLVASGVEFGATFGDTGNSPMAKALRGISGVAAMTSSSYEEIAPIFTKVAGTGRLFATELNSLSMRGINAAATIATYLQENKGMAEATEQTVHDMVRKGQIDFALFSEAMDSAFGKHAKEANKTFEGSLSNMKAALSRIGQGFFEPYRKNMTDVHNSLKEMFNKVKEELDKAGTYDSVANAMERIKNVAVSGITFISQHMGWVHVLAGGFSQILNFIAGAAEAVGNFIAPFIDNPITSTLNSATKGFKAVIDAANSTKQDILTAIFGKDAVGQIQSVETELDNLTEIAMSVWRGDYGNDPVRESLLTEAYGSIEAAHTIQNKVNELLNHPFRYQDALSEEEFAALIGDTEKATDGLTDMADSVVEAKSVWGELQGVLGEVLTSFQEMIAGIDPIAILNWASTVVQGFSDGISMLGNIILSVTRGAMKGFLDIVKSIGKTVGSALERVAGWFSSTKKWMDESGAWATIQEKTNGVFEFFAGIFEYLEKVAGDVMDVIGDAFGKVGDTAKWVGDNLQKFWDQFKNTTAYKKATQFIDGIGESFENARLSITDRLKEIFGEEFVFPEVDMEPFVNSVSEKVDLVIDKFEEIKKRFERIFGGHDGIDVGQAVGAGMPSAVADQIEQSGEGIFAKIRNWWKNLSFEDIFATFQTGFDNIGKIANTALDAVLNMASGAVDGLGGGVEVVFGWVDSLHNWLSELGVYDAIINGATSAFDGLLWVITKVGDVGKSLFGRLPDLLNLIGDAASNVWDNVMTWWDNFTQTETYNTIATALESLWNTLVNIKNTLGSHITTFIDSIIDGTFFDNFSTNFQELMKTLFGEDFKLPEFDLGPAFDFIAEKAAWVIEILGNAKDAILDFFNPSGSKAGASLGAGLGISGDVDATGESLFSFGNILSSVTDLLSSFWETVKAAIPVLMDFGGNVLSGIGTAITTVIGWVKEFHKWMKDSGNYAKIQNALGKAFNFFGKVLKNIGPIAQSVLGFIWNIISWIGDSIIKAKDAIVDWWASFKESETFGHVTKTLENIWDWIVKIKDAIGEKIKSFFGGLFNDDGTFNMPQFNIDDNWVYSGIGKAIDWLKQQFDDFNKAAGEAISILNGETETDKTLTDYVQEWIGDGLNAALKPVIDLFNEAKTAIMEFFGIGAGTEEDKKSNLEKKVDKSKEALNQSARDMLKGLGLVTESDATEAVETATWSLVDRINNMVSVAWEGVLNFVTKVVDKFLELYDRVTPLINTIIGFKWIFGIANLVQGLGGIANNLKKVLGTASKVGKAYARELNARAILEIAGAIAALAAAMWILGSIDPSTFHQAVAGLIAVTGAIAFLMFVLSKTIMKGNGGVLDITGPLDTMKQALLEFGNTIAKGLGKLGVAAIIIGFAAGIALIAGAIIKLSELDFGALMQGAIAVGVIGTALFLLSKNLANMTKDPALSGTKLLGVAAIMVGFAAAIRIMVGAIKKMGSMDFGELAQGILGIAALGFIIKQSIKGLTADIKAGPILALAGVIVAVALSMMALSVIEPSRLNNIANSLLKVFLSIGAMIAATSLLKTDASQSMNMTTILPILAVIAEVMLGVAAIALIVPTEKAAVLDAIGDSLGKIFTSVGIVIGALALFEKWSDDPIVLDPESILMVTIITAIAVAIGAANEILDKQEGIDILQGIADALSAWEPIIAEIGSLVGNLFGGFLKGLVAGITGKTIEELASDFIDEIKNMPDSLQKWADGMNDFLEKLKGIEFDDKKVSEFEKYSEQIMNTVEHFLSIAETFTLMKWNKRVTTGGPSLLGGGSSVMIDEESLVQLLSSWAISLNVFASILTKGGFNEEAANQAVTAAGTIFSHFSDLIGKVEGIGDISKVSETVGLLPSFADGLVAFSWRILFLNTGAITATEEAVKLVNALVKEGIDLGTANGSIPDNCFLGWAAQNKTNLQRYVDDLPGFGEALNKYGDQMKEFQNKSDLVTNTATAVELVNNLAGAAITNGQNMIVTSGAADYLSYINVLAGYSENLGSFGKGLADFSKEMVNFKGGAVRRNAGWAQVVNDLANAAPNVDYSKGIFGWLSGNKLEDLGDQLGNFGSGLAQFSQNISGGQFDSGAVYNSAGAIKYLVKTLSEFQGLTFGDSDESLDAQDTDRALAFVEELMMNISEHLSGEEVTKYMSEIESKAEKLGKEIGEKMSKAFSSGFSGALTDGSFTPTKGEIKNGAMNVGSAFDLENMIQTSDVIAAIHSQFIDPMLTEIQTIYEPITDAGTSAARMFVNALAFVVQGTGPSRLRSAVSVVGQAAFVTINNYQGKFRTAGKNLMLGLEGGIIQGKSGVINAISRMADEAIAKAHEKFEQQSPSHVFERIGLYNMMGLAKGTDEGVSMVMNSVGDAADAVVDRYEHSMDDVAAALGAAYLYINQIMQESMNTNPVITPVLDLSMLQSGMGYANSMLSGSTFGYNNSLAYANRLYPGASLYGSGYQALSPAETQMLQAMNGMRSDIKQLSEAMSTMGITLDSGVMVGALTPGTDRELGNITKFKERWA